MDKSGLKSILDSPNPLTPRGRGPSLQLGQVLCKTFTMSKCQSLASESGLLGPFTARAPWVILVNEALHPFSSFLTLDH